MYFLALAPQRDLRHEAQREIILSFFRPVLYSNEPCFKKLTSS